MRPMLLPIVLSLLAGCSGAAFDVAAPGDDTGAPDAPFAYLADAPSAPPDSPEPDALSDAGPETAPAVDAAPDTAAPPPDAGEPDTATAPDTTAPPPDIGPTFAVTDVSASGLKVDTWITFTIAGSALPPTLLGRIPNCTGAAPVATSGSPTARTLSCKPWASGPTTFNVYDSPGHVVYSKDFTFAL